MEPYADLDRVISLVPTATGMYGLQCGLCTLFSRDNGMVLVSSLLCTWVVPLAKCYSRHKFLTCKISEACL